MSEEGRADTVHWYNGRCFECGCREQRRNVRTAWCKGCGKEVGSWGQGPDDPRQPAAWSAGGEHA